VYSFQGLKAKTKINMDLRHCSSPKTGKVRCAAVGEVQRTTAALAHISSDIAGNQINFSGGLMLSSTGVSVAASVLTIMALSLERYLAIRHL